MINQRYKLLKLNTARNALRYIIRAFGIKEIYIPYYICPALRIAAAKENCRLKFYHIDKFFKPVIDFPEDAFILYPDYFGVSGAIVNDLALKYPNLIADNAHSFFSEPIGAASFNSLRKFFPALKDGSFLYISKTADFNIEQDDFEYDYKELSFDELCRNENRLDYEDIKYMSECTLDYFNKIDLNSVKQQYINNFKENDKKYGAVNNLKLNLPSGAAPYKYPYLASSEAAADKTAEELEKNGKTIFRYWNNLPESFIEKDFYTKLAAL